MQVTREFLYDRILGSLVTSGLGDAMGAATEQWRTGEIIAAHGGLLRTLKKPPIDTFSADNELGQVTDDTSQAYYLAQTLIETDGSITPDIWKQSLLRWANESPHRVNMGPTTRLMVQAWEAGQDTAHIAAVGKSTRKLNSFGVSNGAAMRIAPAGLIHPGDIEGACQTALITCLPTHDTHIAVAGACAVAAGVAEALRPEADVFSVARACLKGARRGEELGKEHARWVPGPSIPLRVELAIELALKARSMEEALTLLEGYLGNGVLMADSAPTAIGLFVFAGGDPLESCVGGANIGSDTDTIAAMSGALAGALKGFKAVPADLWQTLRAANTEFDLEGLAQGLTDIAWRRAPR
ncbi:MAG: ADP-ribosylglycohydrolase family protein [Chloroflexota bacterium]